MKNTAEGMPSLRGDEDVDVVCRHYAFADFIANAIEMGYGALNKSIEFLVL